MEYYTKAIKKSEETGYKYGIAGNYIGISTLLVKMESYDKALDYLRKSLKIYGELGDKLAQANISNNMGGIYDKQGKYEAALDMYNKTLKQSTEIRYQSGIMYATGNIGSVYAHQKKYNEALLHISKALSMAEESGDRYIIAVSVAEMGSVYLGMAQGSDSQDGYGRVTNMASNYLSKAILNFNKAIELHKFLGTISELPGIYKNLSEAYKLSNNTNKALEAYEQYVLYKDSVTNKENVEKITRLEVEGEYRRKQLADSLKNIEAKKLSAIKLQKQKTYTYMGAAAVLLLLGFSFFIVKERGKSEKSRMQAEGLLLNILPAEIADELKDRGATTAKHFDEVTVLFTDFVNFTRAGERMGTEKLVEELHTCFKAFDEIIGKYNIEKIKTIGDAYLAVSGLPVADNKHADNVINAAMDIRAFMQNRRQQLGEHTFEVRIGIHSGPVVAGIVGVKKFAYDIWGDTVNTAARMEQKSEAGKINISQTTYELVKDKYACTYRGEIEAKNKGMLKMYFVEGVA